MNRIQLFTLALSVMLASCSSIRDKDTIAKLRHMEIEIEEEKIEGGLDKAMQSYERFLKQTPDSALTPEAIRRLADLKIEKEYGTLTESAAPAGQVQVPPLLAPERAIIPAQTPVVGGPLNHALVNFPVYNESETDFEKRASRGQQMGGMTGEGGRLVEGGDDLERVGALEAIQLYTRLLDEYPRYGRNDQVLYQMSRAYEELGQTEKAMGVMQRMANEFPRSRYIDEVQFRRAEYFFTHRRYLDAEDAYGKIVNIGVGSSFYELALYKLGWTFFKQELYEDAVHRFIALLDHKVSVGYDFAQTEDEPARKRMEDTFRVVSLSFSNLGGADSMVEYFSRHGKRSFEDSAYSNLGEFYFHKRRYADASSAYKAFVSRNPFHEKAPNFHMRVIEIQAKGGFPSLVLESKKKFATTYSLKAEYWNFFEAVNRPDVLIYLKTNLTDLANHYHACYQDPRQVKEKTANFEEALRWYREFLSSFPADIESAVVNYQVADLLLQNQSFDAAAVEFEKTAYGYPLHEKSSKAGYAAVYAYREHLGVTPSEDMNTVKQEVVRSSLKFAETFPDHEKAAIVLGAAADDLYGMKDYEQALATANRLIEVFPGTDVDVVRSAWLVIGHSSYELLSYSEAESAYLNVLTLLPVGDESRDGLTDNLAAAIYKQGELANTAQDYQAAADHFLRVGQMASGSTIWPTAEYDAAAALIQLKDWEMAASVLLGFRDSFPDHSLQPEVTKKIAYVYRENNQFSLAANEYERIEEESQDDDIRRDALLVAADLHEKDGKSVRALEVYQRYVAYFPQPVELNLETRSKMAQILKVQNDWTSYLNELEKIVAIDAAAGIAQTPRTRYLAAQAALVLAEQSYDAFVAVRLVKPLEANLRRKRELMTTATQKFGQITEYELGEFTAAATFYIAEIYGHFSNALTNSERPEGLSPLEREEYELGIEEQAYPFEERAIAVHENNLTLISRGVYNVWIDKSLEKLAELVPVRYDKMEETSGIVSSLDSYIFEIDRPAPIALAKSEFTESAGDKEPGIVPDPETGELVNVEESGAAAGSEIGGPAQVEASVSVSGPHPGEAVKVDEAEAVSVSDFETGVPAPAEEPVGVTEAETDASAKDKEQERAEEPVEKEEQPGNRENVQSLGQAAMIVQSDNKGPSLTITDRVTGDK